MNFIDGHTREQLCKMKPASWGDLANMAWLLRDEHLKTLAQQINSGKGQLRERAAIMEYAGATAEGLYHVYLGAKYMASQDKEAMLANDIAARIARAQKTGSVIAHFVACGRQAVISEAARDKVEDIDPCTEQADAVVIPGATEKGFLKNIKPFEFPVSTEAVTDIIGEELKIFPDRVRKTLAMIIDYHRFQLTP